MSVATSFRFHKPFPFCPEEFDIDALNPADYSLTAGFIRDLTLADAMALYWNLESVRVQFSASAQFSGGTVDVSVVFDEEFLSSPVYAPRERVCDIGISPYYLGQGTETNGETVTDSGGPITMDYSVFFFNGMFSSGSLPSTAVSVQTDGKYTLWCTILTTSGNIYLGSAGTAGGLIDIGGSTISVLSGSITLRAYANLAYSGGGTVTALDFTPGFYTYP
jgi:hypothetical protein